MPVVPFNPTSTKPKRIDIPAADEPWLLMAAAMMDEQGRLVESDTETTPAPSEDTTL